MRSSLPDVFAVRQNQPKAKCTLPTLPEPGKTPVDLGLLKRENKFLFGETGRAAHRTRALLHETV